MGQHAALGHADHGVTQAADKIHIVLDHAKGIAAFLIQAQNRVANGAQQGAVHAGADLVQKHDFGVNHHGAPQLQQLFLPARQVARQLVGNMRDFKKLDHLVGLGANFCLFGAHDLAVKPCAPQGLARLFGRHHHQVVAHRKGRKLVRDLEGAQQALFKQLVRGQARYILIIQKHPAGCGFVMARHHVEQRGFARAIGADQPGDTALFDL